MLSTPPRDTRDVDKLLKYSESLNALRRRVAIEQARSKGRDAAVVSSGKSEPVLDVIVRTSPIRGDPRSFDESPFKPEVVPASMGLTQRHHSFADELNTVLALASPGASASDAAASHEALLARSSATAAGFKFAELLTETEHLSDVVTSLRREAAEREASWQERVRLLKLDIDDRDKKIDQHRATEEKLTLAVDQLKARLDAVNAPNTNQVEASLRRSLAELESRYKSLEDDTLQRDQLIRFQETEIRRLESLVSATSAAVAEAERRSAAAVEEAATRVSQLEDERLLLLSQKRDADLALAATRTSLTALSASLSSPPRRSASGVEAVGVADDNEANEADDANSSSISAVVVKLHAELEAVRQRCSHLQTEHLKAQHQSAQLKTRCEGLAAKVVEAETQRAHADEDLAAARDEMSRIKAARTADESKRQQLKNALDRAQRQIDAAAAESASQVRGLEDELRLKQLRIGHLEASLADAEKRHREATELGSESENRVRTRVGDLEAQLQLAEAELKQMSSRLEHEKASAVRAVALSGDAQERFAELEQRLLAEEQAARERAATASLTIAELKREASSLRSEAAAAVERSEAALRDAQTARKQRDVALERNTLLQASLQKELDNATVSAKSQLKQLAGVLARREDEVSRLRERVAVLEATQTANAMAIEQQQLTLDAMYNHSAQHTASKNRSRTYE